MLKTSRIFLGLFAFVSASFVTAQSLPSAELIEKVSPAIVNIAVAPGPGYRNPMFTEAPVRRPREGGARGQPHYSAGSGVIVDAERGLIVTNHHIVENTRGLLVRLDDRRDLVARHVKSDVAANLAVLQIAANDLQALSPADLNAVKVGQEVFAIGNPYGLGTTIGGGSVVALGTNGGAFMETDAPVNRGTTGGALVDDQGRLVGINSTMRGGAAGSATGRFVASVAKVLVLAQLPNGVGPAAAASVAKSDEPPKSNDASVQTFKSEQVLDAVVRVDGQPSNVIVRFGNVRNGLYRVQLAGVRAVDMTSPMFTLMCAAARVMRQVRGANAMIMPKDLKTDRDGTFLIGFAQLDDEPISFAQQLALEKRFAPDFKYGDSLNLHTTPAIATCNKGDRPTGKFVDLPPNFRMPS